MVASTSGNGLSRLEQRRAQTSTNCDPRIFQVRLIGVDLLQVGRSCRFGIPINNGQEWRTRTAGDIKGLGQKVSKRQKLDALKQRVRSGAYVRDSRNVLIER